MSMAYNKKTADDAANIVSGHGQGAQAGGPIRPCCQFITAQEKAQGVSAVLLKGAENAIRGADLVKIVGYRSDRRLRKLVAKEQRSGSPSLSSPSVGYFLPSEGNRGREEAARFVSRMERMGGRRLGGLNAVQAILGQPEGQIRLEDDQDGEKEKT